MGSIELCCFKANSNQEQDNHLARFLLCVHQLAVLHNVPHIAFPLPDTVVLNSQSTYLHHSHPYEHCLTDFTTKLTPKLYADSIDVLTCMPIKQQSVSAMVADIFQMKTVADRAWTMQSRATNSQMKEYLLLNARTVLTAVNQQVSIGNGVSLRRMTRLIRFICEQICGEGNVQSEDYSLRMAVHTAECSQYAVGAAIYFTCFALFSNLNNPHFSTLKAREQLVEMRVTDAKLTGRRNYFTFDGRLFLLPFALLRIASINQKDDRKCILLEWVTEQPLLDRILSDSAVQSSKRVTRQMVQAEMEESLKGLSDVGWELQKQMCKQYYRDYLQSREENQQMMRKAILTQQQNKLALQKEWELQESYRLLRSVDIKQIKLQSQKQKSQQQSDMSVEQRQLPLRVVSPSEALQFGKELQAYIKDKDLLKMEKQLSRSLDFTTMKTLNLSSCHLKAIEHMQCLPNLEELYLYNNHICVIEGLQRNYSLNLLSLTYNQIVVLEHVHELPELRKLYVSRNLLGADSAAYLVNYKLGLRELAISFTRQNAQAESILLQNQWRSLKTLVLVTPSIPPIQHRRIKKIIFIPW